VDDLLPRSVFGLIVVAAIAGGVLLALILRELLRLYGPSEDLEDSLPRRARDRERRRPDDRASEARRPGGDGDGDGEPP
jgi:hypothetical protein